MYSAIAETGAFSYLLAELEELTSTHFRQHIVAQPVQLVWLQPEHVVRLQAPRHDLRPPLPQLGDEHAGGEEVQDGRGVVVASRGAEQGSDGVPESFVGRLVGEKRQKVGLRAHRARSDTN